MSENILTIIISMVTLILGLYVGRIYKRSNLKKSNETKRY